MASCCKKKKIPLPSVADLTVTNGDCGDEICLPHNIDPVYLINPGGSGTVTTLALVSGNDSNIPAGLQSVTINNRSGLTIVNGTYQLGSGRRDDSITFNTDEGETLPAITVSGGHWQWIGLQ